MVEKLAVMAILFIMMGGTTSIFSSDNSPATEVRSIFISENLTIIKIAILDSVIPSFSSPTEMKEILNRYSWTSKSIPYEFETEFITDIQISIGMLKGYDLLLIPGIGKEFRRPINSDLLSQWKNEVRSFVSSGGGYLGTCGGANMASQGLLNASERGWEKDTAWEWFMNRSAIGIAPVRSYQDMGDPMACSLIENNPARIGQSAYVWYNLSIESSGVCQHCMVNGEHPIFHGYEYDTRIIRWVGGPALILENRNVTVLASR